MSLLPAPRMPFWISEQLPFDRYMVDVGDGLSMHVMEQGSGLPVLAFHGNPTWGYLYRKVAAGLVGEPLRLIMPDLIGLGFSDRPRAVADHTLANHSRWVSALIDRLELRQAVAVVHDWGGPIGLHALSRHPGTMRGLVVMNTMLGPPKPGFRPTTFHRLFSAWPGELVAAIPGVPGRWLGLAQADRKSLRDVVGRSYAYPLSRRRDGRAFTALARMVPDTMEHPSVALLAEVGRFASSFDGPAAIVWGDADPVLGRLLRRTERTLPHAEVTATPAGHFVQEEAPDEVVAAIRSVMARI